MTEISDCDCITEGPGGDCERRELGMNSSFGEVSVRTCKTCGRRWLHYFWEHEAFTGSQRYHAGYLADVQVPKLDDAVTLLNSLSPRFTWFREKACWMPESGLVRASGF